MFLGQEEKRKRYQLFGSFIYLFFIPLILFSNPLLFPTNGYQQQNETYVDKTPPVVKLKENVIDDRLNQGENFLQSNEPVSLINSSSFLSLSEPRIQDNTYIYPVHLSTNQYNKILKLKFADQVGNTSETWLFVNPWLKATNQQILGLDSSPTCQLFDPKEDILTLQIDKLHCVEARFEKNFEFAEFQMQGKLVKVHQIVYFDLLKMMNAASQDGISLAINSAYRDFDDQYDINTRFTEQLGPNRAEKLTATPGHSEHQLGIAIDFGTSEYIDKAKPFEDTLAYKWLNKNAWKYGFVLSYPEGKQSITGYSFEPWHWRYMGLEHASNIHKLGIFSPQEYLALIENSKD